MLFPAPDSAFTGTPWANGTVYYVFDAAVATINRQAWRDAASDWSAVAQLSFVEGTGTGNYIYVQNSTGNNSFIGMIGGQQVMNISAWGSEFIIAHEIGHALGAIHEHQRSDRDAFISIQLSNIQSNFQVPFVIRPSTNYGVYDFDSVMHYGKCTFSIDCPAGSTCDCIRNSILVLPPNDVQWQDVIGQRNHLSQLDQSGMAARYAGIPTPSPSPTPNPASTILSNISTRLMVLTDTDVLIGGFIIIGSGTKNIAVRGVGPSLGAFGIPDALADPTIELRDMGNTLVLANDDWQSNSGQAEQLTELNLALPDAKESGLVTTISPGPYTTILAGKNQTTGVGLVEIYDVDSGSAAQLGNISTRGFIQTGSNVMIGGFILGGINDIHIVVRGIGPSLTPFGIPNVLSDPSLELHDGNGATLASNDNWQDDSDSASHLTGLGLGLPDSAESGIYASLPPGAFTAILAGKNEGTGVGLLEIYNVH